MKVLAIVPAFNEADSVAAVVAEILSLGSVDVLVVNDGSTDETVAIARRAGARVLNLPFNLGIGGAVQAGYLYAMRKDYDVAVQVDGDGQHDATEIPKLLEALSKENADLVLGSRALGPPSYRVPPSRRVGMRIFSATVSMITRQQLLDTTSGFRAAGKEAIAYLAENYPRDYPEVEALVLLRRAGFRIMEVSCRFRERAGGQSSITPLRSIYYVIKVHLAIIAGLFRSIPPRTPAGESP
ncbi:MAG TPA: glycosyltransferase family 2 protein [bacterium]|nr:glycosyltransferase family 2 protein [bacterium]